MSYYDLLKIAGYTPQYCTIGELTDADIISYFYDIKNTLKKCPTLIEMKNYAIENNILVFNEKIYWRWGNYTNFLKDINELDKKKLNLFFSEDGSRCYSTYEKIICDVLYNLNVFYEKDILYKNFIKGFNKKWTVDYYLPFFNLYIEIFGIESNAEYDFKTKQKQKIFKNNKLNLLSIFPSDFINNNYKMNNYIKTKLPLYDSSGTENIKIAHNKYIN